MGKSLSWKGIAVFLCLAGLAACLAGCAKTEEKDAGSGAGAPAVTAPIKIGSITGTLGPLDVTVTVKAIQVYLDTVVNPNGGVNGRPVELVFYDDGIIDPNKTLQFVKKLVEDDGVVAIVGGFFPLSWQNIQGYLEQAGVPVIGPEGVHSTEYTSPISFPLNMSPVDWGIVDARYAGEVMGKKRIAIVNTEGTGYMLDWQKGVEQYVAAHPGMEIVKTVTVGAGGGEVNFTPLILQLKRSAPEVVLLHIGEGDYPRIFQELERQGWKPDMICTSACMGSTISQAVPEFLKGVIASNAFETTDVNPSYHAYRTDLERLYPNTAENPYGFNSYLAAKLFCDVAASIPPGDISRKTITDGLHGLRGWKSGATEPMSFTPEDHSANTGRIYFEYVGESKWFPVSGWISVEK